jgi:DNA-binding NarL/FixJ family response regulator
LAPAFRPEAANLYSLAWTCAAAAGRAVPLSPDPGPGARPFPQLTEREREILALMANGWQNGRIARHLSLSIKTVANNVSAILAKLQAPDRSAAIVAARRAGLGDP